MIWPIQLSLQPDQSACPGPQKPPPLCQKGQTGAAVVDLLGLVPVCMHDLWRVSSVTCHPTSQCSVLALLFCLQV